MTGPLTRDQAIRHLAEGRGTEVTLDLRGVDLGEAPLVIEAIRFGPGTRLEGASFAGVNLRRTEGEASRSPDGSLPRRWEDAALVLGFMLGNRIRNS